MFKTLGLVCLLVPSVVSQTFNVEKPKNIINSNQIFGSYNFYDNYEGAFYNILDNEDAGDFEVVYDITFTDGLPLYANYINLYNDLWFLEQIEIIYGKDSYGGYYCEVTFDYYSGDLISYSKDFLMCDGSDYGDGYSTVDSTDVYRQNLIICVTTPVLVNDNVAKLFNAIFTHEDNSFTYTYSGYYNFMGTSTINVSCALYGTITYDSSWAYCINASASRSSGNTTFDTYYQDINYLGYGYMTRVVNLPTSQNIMLNGVKMTLTSYQRFNALGTFSYVYDPGANNTTFSDLLFTVMDTPVYFLSRLLSFELFGVNMFIAFTGLLTLLVILLLIRKFF